MKNFAFLLFIVLLAISCTDAQLGKISSIGGKQKVEILSGGQVVRTYISSGKVVSESGSDWYYFTDSQTGKLIEVSGDLIITQID